MDRRLFLFAALTAALYAQTPPVINLPERALERIPAFVMDTRITQPQIDPRPSIMPKKPSNPVAPPDFAAKPNNLQPGGMLSVNRLGDNQQWPAIGSTGWYPPDPDLAVGMNHVVAVVNSSVAFFTKSGTKQYQQTASTFFSGIGAGSFIFDPKCIYDRIHDRFVIIFLEEDDVSQTSKVLMAVSDDGDPNGTWYRYRVEAKLVLSGVGYWMDYPGLGYNKDAYVINGNMFGFTSGWGGVQFLVIPSAPMLTGQTAQVVSLRDAGGASVQMAEVIDATNPYVFGTSRSSGSSIRAYAVSSPGTITPAITFYDVAVPSNSSPAIDAPSTNGRTLDSVDGRVFNSIWRSGKLLTAHSSSNGNLVARWYELNTNSWPASGTPTLGQAGVVSSPDLHYFTPAINKNANGDISLLFTGSSSTVTANVMSASRLVSDASGAMGTPGVLQVSAGNDYSLGRWGDYFGVDVDPVDDTTFYGVGQWVAADNRWTTSVFSWTVAPGAAPPVSPTGLTATAVSGSSINLAWTDASSDETGFRIERSTDNVTFVLLASTSANTTVYSDTGLTTDVRYYYRVRAYNSVGESLPSNTANTVPPSVPGAPSGLTASATSASQINLSWTDNATNESGFKIERSADGVSFTQIATVLAGVTTYSNTGLAGTTTYYYRVRATNVAGDSGYSNAANATTLASVPTAPSGLTATAVSANQINLSWTDNSGNETGFKIERLNSRNVYVEIAMVGAGVRIYSNTGLTARTKYTYRVRAYNGVGNSGYSNTASATTTR